MCIVFFYDGSKDPESEYHFIVASNRDEKYDRPSQNLGPWPDTEGIFGGLDNEKGGTWLAVNAIKKKVGVLLNLPSKDEKSNAKTRGKLVADYVKFDGTTKAYIDSIKAYGKECNGFLFVGADYSSTPTITAYSNANSSVNTFEAIVLGFSNSLPDSPLQKVVGGKTEFSEICNRRKKYENREALIDDLFKLLKSEKKYLPDPLLEKSYSKQEHEFFSSIYVCIPEKRFGTRTHTLLLITKSGKSDIIEMSFQAPIDLQRQKWMRSEIQFSEVSQQPGVSPK